MLALFKPRDGTKTVTCGSQSWGMSLIEWRDENLEIETQAFLGKQLLIRNVACSVHPCLKSDRHCIS